MIRALVARVRTWLWHRGWYVAPDADVLARQVRIDNAVRAGEREAVALFLEYYEQDKLAAEIRAGAHLARLTGAGGKEPF